MGALTRLEHFVSYENYIVLYFIMRSPSPTVFKVSLETFIFQQRLAFAFIFGCLFTRKYFGKLVRELHMEI